MNDEQPCLDDVDKHIVGVKLKKLKVARDLCTIK
jgi:hypothetical protein